MVLRRRFEIVSPAPPNDVLAILTDVKNYLRWFRDFIEVINIQSDRSADIILFISGGRYGVTMSIDEWVEGNVHYVRVVFSGRFHMILTLMVEPSDGGSRVSGELEIAVGFFWERMLKGFASDLVSRLSRGINEAIQALIARPVTPIAPSETARVERREVKKAEPPLAPLIGDLRMVNDPRKLEDIVLLSTILMKSKLISTRRVNDVVEFINELRIISEEFKNENVYVVFRNKVAVSVLIEKGVITGLRIKFDSEEVNGKEVLDRLSELEEFKGVIHIFRVPGTL